MRKRYGWAILKAWEHGAICQLCGQPVAVWTYGVVHPEAATLDHIVHRAHGGADSYENVQLAHKLCNNRKHLPSIRPDQLARLTPEQRALVATRKAKQQRERQKRRQTPRPTTNRPWRCAKCDQGHDTRQQAFDCCEYGWKENAS